MNRPAPQFRARLKFHFWEHGPDRWNKFVFPENGHRRIPMQIDGVEGLHTVGMWLEGTHEFHTEDEVDVDCVVLWTEGFHHAVLLGAKFALWDGGFFADGTVLERFDDAWPAATSTSR